MGLGARLSQGLPYALISGGIVLVAFLALPPQSLPHKYLAGDINLVIPYAIASVLAASVGILVVLSSWGRRGGRRPPWRHLAVPLMLGVLIPVVLALAGGARSRPATGLLCAAVAAGAHLVLGLRQYWTRLLLWGSMTGLGALVAVSSQTRWRAADFRATHLPFHVAEVPGYRLTGTYADVGVIFLEYRPVTGEPMRMEAVIARRTCREEPAAGARCFDLPGAHLTIYRPSQVGNAGIVGTVPAGITIHPVSAARLASYPVGSESLPD